MDPILTVEQTAVLTALVTLLISALSIVWVGILKKPKPSKQTMIYGCFGISLVFGLLWTPLALPAFPAWGGDPNAFIMGAIAWAGAMLALATVIMKTAQKVYDWIVGPILGWLDSTVVAKIAGIDNVAAWIGFLRPKRLD